jgi:D-psicose/D-tagatose/L-ribulose 3-epimerase
MIESIDKLARYAAPYDLKLGIEVLYFDETDLVNNSDDVLYIINQLNHKNIGVVLDTGTLNLSKESPEEIFLKLKDLILQIHVNDNHGGKHQQNLIPGDGNFDFRGFIRVLKKSGYQGFLSAELSKEYAVKAESALRTTAERMRSWIQEVEP